jgi:hypothetical protein
MQMQNDLREVLVEVKRLKCSVGQGATQLTKTIALGFVTLVDATGYKHHLQVNHCASFQVRLTSANLHLKEAYPSFSLATQYDGCSPA